MHYDSRYTTHMQRKKVWGVFLFLFLGIYFVHISANPEEWHFFDGVNLIFHEAGHAIFFFLGEFLQIAAGSLLQVGIPLSIVFYFFFQKKNFSSYVTLFWVGQSIVNVSVYAGDAVRMQLPLLGGVSVIHDWNYLLSSLHLLWATEYIAGFLYILGYVCYAGATYLGITHALGMKAAWLKKAQSSVDMHG
jgi:hypothetical protein